ncbi:MAG: cupin domain-containing protein [Deltaproteobacteria bacterium]|nr:cupin domain-containing protein [Deltaproteobacteria bacterium]
MTVDAAYWITRLELKRHPEGGYYRETYRSDELIASCALPERFREGDRSFCTAIYFLLAGDDFSAFHRLKSDEVWHFHAGAALTIHVLDEVGNYTRRRVGGGGEEGESFQAVIRAGNWFGASLEEKDSFALVGCTVAPGFDFRDFEMGDRNGLIRTHPRHRSIIERLTRVRE